MPGKKQRPDVPYSEEIASLICERVADGGNLNALCREPDMPSRDSVYRWFREHPEFKADYEVSRQTRADSRSDRLDELVDKLERGELDPTAGKVMIDTLKWQAGKESPRYADRQIIEGNTDRPVTFAVDVQDRRALLDLARRVALLLHQAQPEKLKAIADEREEE